MTLVDRAGVDVQRLRDWAVDLPPPGSPALVGVIRNTVFIASWSRRIGEPDPGRVIGQRTLVTEREWCLISGCGSPRVARIASVRRTA